MATNFRLAYTNGIEYIDLFPKTSVTAIVDVQNIYDIVQVDVNIPAPTSPTLTQTVALSTTPAMVAAPFRVYLSSTGTQAESDYATINQIEVRDNQLVITRLGDMPVGAIDVTLVFYEVRGEVDAN